MAFTLHFVVKIVVLSQSQALWALILCKTGGRRLM
jgi:hypothetical protein